MEGGIPGYTCTSIPPLLALPHKGGGGTASPKEEGSSQTRLFLSSCCFFVFSGRSLDPSSRADSTGFPVAGRRPQGLHRTGARSTASAANSRSPEWCRYGPTRVRVVPHFVQPMNPAVGAQAARPAFW